MNSNPSVPIGFSQGENFIARFLVDGGKTRKYPDRLRHRIAKSAPLRDAAAISCFFA
jgi:hypothetical protein